LVGLGTVILVFVLDVFEPLPRAEMVDHFRLVQPVDRFGERVVVRIAPTTAARFDAGLEPPISVANCEVLRPPLAVMDERRIRLAIVECLLERIERELRAQRRRGPTPTADSAASP